MGRLPRRLNLYLNEDRQRIMNELQNTLRIRRRIIKPDGSLSEIVERPKMPAVLYWLMDKWATEHLGEEWIKENIRGAGRD